MRALVDADILAYEFGGMVQLEAPEKPLEWEIVRSMVDDRINQILEATGSDSYSLYLTDSKSNFRMELATILPYKGNRKTEKPYHWERIRQHLIDNWGAEVQYGIEADDRLGIEQMKCLTQHGVRLYLKNGSYTILDWEDYERLSPYDWSMDSKGYPCRYTKDSTIYLHKEVLEAEESQVVDHINRDTLDNRRCNLRACSRTENIRNSGPRKGSSVYKGVSWHKSSGLWTASIRCNGEYIHLGYYEAESEAAKAYDDAAIKHFGKYAYLNFSNNNSVPKFEETVIGSRDKDLNMIPGNHYSWACGKQKERLWYESSQSSIRHFYRQLLTGDVSDHILGLYGVGASSQLVKRVESCDEERLMFDIVYKAYQDRFGSYAPRFIGENAALLWMLRKEPDTHPETGVYMFPENEIHARLELFLLELENEQ